ncbi:hypothetical protein GGTG_05907 [Gaeumannomyces tritici R3-111a-1]|uniref:Uncharacterized protein n=1 Tax=Gaeumannomyces tritici (strain R3-111a-1) TaxID=644352 RepID=J3NXA0_GAET3|nr:hypothetical protein GGTG_05907 [Gaeumannomyces tritici R3-111a-1]EJT75982.1 hypothetical protein GGTG_05907 [Gaeumannomyces tritici R3-111a-1]
MQDRTGDAKNEGKAGYNGAGIGYQILSFILPLPLIATPFPGRQAPQDTRQVFSGKPPGWATRLGHREIKKSLDPASWRHHVSVAAGAAAPSLGDNLAVGSADQRLPCRTVLYGMDVPAAYSQMLA